jgi:hypothetical protein
MISVPGLLQGTVILVVVNGLDQHGDPSELLPVLSREGLFAAECLHNIRCAQRYEFFQSAVFPHPQPSVSTEAFPVAVPFPGRKKTMSAGRKMYFSKSAFRVYHGENRTRNGILPN